MKTIQSVQIWDNGKIKTAAVLNAYAINVILNQSATFYYSLYDLKENVIDNSIVNGNVYMGPEEYALWDQDEFAWDFIAKSLNLTITGDYIPPTPVENIEENA